MNKSVLDPVRSLVDQIQVQRPILVVATNPMPDHILGSSIISIDSNITDKKVINIQQEKSKTNNGAFARLIFKKKILQIREMLLSFSRLIFANGNFPKIYADKIFANARFQKITVLVSSISLAFFLANYQEKMKDY